MNTKNPYRANVKVFNESILLDTETGEGLDLVLKKIQPLVCKMACNKYLQDHDYDDLKSELNILAIEGIYSYIPNDNLKLSTYLMTHLRNKFFSKIKKDNKLSHDASFFKQAKVNINSGMGTTIKRTTHRPVTMNSVTHSNDDINSSASFEKYSSTYHMIFNDPKNVEFEKQLIKQLDRLSENDPEQREIVELLYFHNYTLTEIARKFNVRPSSISLKLQKLARSPGFIKILELYRDADTIER